MIAAHHDNLADGTGSSGADGKDGSPEPALETMPAKWHRPSWQTSRRARQSD